MKKLTLTIAISLAVALAALGGIWLFLRSHDIESTTPASQQTTYESLMTSNSSFAQGAALAASGDYAGAIPKYRESLAIAASDADKAQIEYKLGIALEQTGDVESAIDIYQHMATNAKYSKIARAYATQQMAKIFDYSGDTSVTAKIFSVTPFSTMIATTSDAVSYRHLYEYAVSLFPLADSELHIANYYAIVLSRSYHGEAPVSAKAVAAMKKIVSESMAAANADIERIKTDSNESQSLPDILTRKANVLGILAGMGMAPATTTLAAFQSALNSYTVMGPGKDGTARFFFASYLLGADAASTTIQKVLAPIYTTSDYADSRSVSFFRTERLNALNEKSVLQELAKRDPKFKSYLVSLGWTAADF